MPRLKQQWALAKSRLHFRVAHNRRGSFVGWVTTHPTLLVPTACLWFLRRPKKYRELGRLPARFTFMSLCEFMESR